MAEAFLLRALGAGLLFLMNVILARQMGAQGYGVFSYALFLASVAAIMVTLGLPNGAMRFVAEYREKCSWAELKGVAVRSFQLVLGGAVAGALTLLLLSVMVPMEVELRWSVVYASLLLPISSVGLWRSRVAVGLDRIRLSIIPEELVLPTLVLLGCIWLVAATPRDVTMIYLAAGGLSLVIGTWCLLQRIPEEVKESRARHDTRRLLKVSIPMTVGTLMQLGLNRSDVFLLGAMVGMEAAGTYTAASRLALLVVFGLRVVDSVSAPRFAAAYHNGDPGELRRLFKRLMIVTAGTGLPFFLPVMVAPGFALGIFGTGFDEASTVLRILAVGQLANAVKGPAVLLFLMTGNERIYALLVTAALVLNVFLNFVAIQFWQSLGAACATALVNVLYSCVSIILAARLIRRVCWSGIRA